MRSRQGGGPNFKANESESFIVVSDNQEQTGRCLNAVVSSGGAASACMIFGGFAPRVELGSGPRGKAR